jgi:HAD superfamily hydrolase (TIGR01509 family)
MDGTLIDSEPIWYETEVATLAGFGYQLGREHLPNVMGKPAHVSIAYLLKVSGADLTFEELDSRISAAMVERLREGIDLMPGAKQLLTELDAAAVPMALVSASTRLIVDASLGSIGPEHFALTVSGDDVPHNKPHPDPYLRAAELLGVAPAQCVVIEDTPTGATAGLAAGCRVVGVPHEVPIPPAPGLTIVRSLLEVDVAYLRGLFG